MSAEELRAKIREIPDFPKPGILFYDITTLLKDAAAYKEAIDLMLAPYAGEQIDIVVGHGVARLHLQRADGLPARRGPRPGPQAGQAAGRDDHRRVRPRVRLEHARDPPRRDPARPEGPDRRRPARDRRHGQGHDRARRAAARARSSASRSSSSSTSSRAATGSRDGASRASSSTDATARSRHERLADPPERPGRAEPPSDRRRRRRPRPRRRADAGRGPRGRRAAGGRGRSRPAALLPAFAGELIQTAATVAGAAQALQQASAEAAGAILDPAGAAALLGAEPATTRPDAGRPGRPASGRRSARTAGSLYLIDQRRLPDALVEVPVPVGRRGRRTRSAR